MKNNKILLGHGSGGRLMHSLIQDLLLKKLDNPILREMADSALINYKEKLAFTTDSFVVSPLEFPGGDIGKLAVCGTVNDLVMQGASPEYLSLALIIEEGLCYHTLERIIDSISLSAQKARVSVVTGDLKVVEKGSCDKIFINTSGIGRIVYGRKMSIKNILPQNKIIITANIAQHGLAVLTKRKGLELGFEIKSDCAALNSLLTPILKETDGIKFMRDPTRGGLATTLNEISASCGLSIFIDEKTLPISTKVKAACELLGIDPLYIANEGSAVLVVAPKSAKQVLNLLRRHPLGKNAQVIGEVAKERRGQVILNNVIGTQRIVDMLTSDPLPRIC
ncbi:MAG: hydrogenase expression/formation protein HypE [Omnitrophica WOR_2 bacterium RBG_13_41_10]|nr:MAG: hydrogenase expression/formation protein HypE [Omnitrophica WOR_2 bacterium RBG_13_41_10]